MLSIKVQHVLRKSISKVAFDCNHLGIWTMRRKCPICFHKSGSISFWFADVVRLPGNDARALRKALHNLSFSLYICHPFDNSHVRLLDYWLSSVASCCTWKPKSIARPQQQLDKRKGKC